MDNNLPAANESQASKDTKENFFETKLFKDILLGIGVLIVLATVFNMGIHVGYHKATFSYGVGDGYYRVFEGRSLPPPMPASNMHGAFFVSHGALGKIVSISLPTFVLADQDEVEKTIMIGDDTIIRTLRDEITPQDLQVGNTVVVLGAPTESAQIDAKLIRVMPDMGMPNGMQEVIVH
jgi:hypothetical protein